MVADMVTVEWNSESKPFSSQLLKPDCDSCCGDEFSLDDHSTEDLLFAPDPYRCTLQIQAKPEEIDLLKEQYGPLLEGIDPTFQFIIFKDSEVTRLPFCMTENEDTSVHDEPENIESLPICIMLFLNEKLGPLSASSLEKRLKFPPWRLHHRMELPQNVQPRVTAKQDFYFLSPELPLWSVSPVHCGNEHLRFQIFVRDLSKMKCFYETLVGTKCEWSSSTFCYFTLYRQSGLDIQMSLKYLHQISPKSNNSVLLKFKTQNIDLLAPYLDVHLIPYEEGSWLTRDPEGNLIVIEETHPRQCKSHQILRKRRSLDTSDYDTASAISLDTDSNECCEQFQLNCSFITNLEGTMI